jgi:CBS domain-containing protein
VSQQEWHHSTGNLLLIPLNDQNTIALVTDVLQARSLMTRTGNTRLIVMANNRLVGIVALKNLLMFLLLTIDFEEIR